MSTQQKRIDHAPDGYLGCRQTEEIVVYVGIRANYIYKQSEPKSYLITDNLNICEGVTTNTLQKYDAYTSWWLSQIFSGYYVGKIIVVTACSLIQASLTPSSVVTNCKILVVRYGLLKIPQWLSYTTNNR